MPIPSVSGFGVGGLASQETPMQLISGLAFAGLGGR